MIISPPGIDDPARIPIARRAYLLLRHARRRIGDTLGEGIWRAKQEEEPGTPLPADIPHRDRLAAAGYTAAEDLTGATADELEALANLSMREARAVLRAMME